MRDESAEVIRPQDVSVTREALELIGRNFAERYRVCPLNLSDARGGMRTLTVATCNPSDLPLIVAGVEYARFVAALEAHTLVGGVFYNVTGVPDADAANRCMDLVREYRL